MDTLRLQNYRCLEDTGDVEIKPLTFLVGSNSSGKSSFLKFFPLLRQSMMIRKRGAFLWTGHDVDLKDFSNMLRHGTDKMDINFSLHDVSISKRMRTLSKDSFSRVKVQLTLQKDQEHFDSITNLKITLPNHTIEFDVTNKIIMKVGSVCSSDLKDEIELTETSSLFSRLYFSQKGSHGEESFNCVALARKIAEKYIRDTSKFSYFLVFSKIGISKEDLKYRLEGAWKKNVEDEDLDKFFDLNYYYNANNILDSINIYMLSLAKNISYIGPLREATERYYRFQNYAVDEIEPDGSNLAMYLYNLDANDLANLNTWLSDIFQFKIKVHSIGGHVELKVEEKGKVEENLVDIGFGYTQILPILVTIWKKISKDIFINQDPNLFNAVHLIAIEQPELHLHPRFQSFFAEVLVNAISKSQKENNDVRFIIETHSEMILNKIGELIAEKHLDRKLVNVVLFNAQNENMNNYVEFSSYSEDGFLTHWPIGFFAENVD